ncbi:MAG TPA: ABC transporter ATP-binding protein, partial [Kiloniellaceae bacterium]|nr:ABC transporter ATP-binding protein [Kiloniellaceae bacterium]
MADVRLQGVSKAFDEVTVIPALDLEIADTEFVVLVGPSGCGKTTTLRMIAGLEAASGGTITIGARDVTQLRPGLRNCAMVFQNYALYPHMTV